MVKWIKKPVIHPHPTVINAPAVNSRSNNWTHGSIHRDHGDTKADRDIAIFDVFLDKVEKDNGAIQMWTNSMDHELDEHNKKRSVMALESTLATGNTGTLHIMNGRLLHRSLPNARVGVTDNTLRLHWIVSLEGGAVPER